MAVSKIERSLYSFKSSLWDVFYERDKGMAINQMVIYNHLNMTLKVNLNG